MTELSSCNFGRKRWYLAEDVDKRMQELEEETRRHLRAADDDISKRAERELNLLKEMREVKIENARLKAREAELQTLKDQLRALLRPTEACVPSDNETGSPAGDAG